jgi:hypothetical protein
LKRLAGLVGPGGGPTDLSVGRCLANTEAGARGNLETELVDTGIDVRHHSREADHIEYALAAAEEVEQLLAVAREDRVRRSDYEAGRREILSD